MKDYVVSLAISSDELLRYYSGGAAVVRARSSGGVVVQFPAASLRPFVDHAGILGRFCLSVDGSGRLLRVRRI